MNGQAINLESLEPKNRRLTIKDITFGTLSVLKNNLVLQTKMNEQFNDQLDLAAHRPLHFRSRR